MYVTANGSPKASLHISRMNTASPSRTATPHTHDNGSDPSRHAHCLTCTCSTDTYLTVEYIFERCHVHVCIQKLEKVANVNDALPVTPVVLGFYHRPIVQQPIKYGRSIIVTRRICFRFPIYCAVSKRDRHKSDCGRKSTPNFAFLTPAKVRARWAKYRSQFYQFILRFVYYTKR